MIKISIHEPMPHSAVSYYRSIGTLSYLHKLNPEIQIDIPKAISWSVLAGADILYLERPQQDNDLKALKLAKDFNAKIWVDFDDLLHEVPEYNPSYSFYKKTHALKNVEKAMEMADIITVSTQALHDYYYEMNNNIHVIENAHNDYQYKFNKIEKTTDTINWRGSTTHRQDLLSVAENIFDIANRYEKWGWTLIGNDIWYIKDKIKNHFNLGECDIVDFNKFILEVNAAIQIVPLLFSDFNRAKSNIGWLEGTYTGSVTVAPDLPEFNKPGCINYMQKIDSFGYYLEKAIKSKSYRQENYLKSYEYIKENLLLSKINLKRLEIIERIL